MPRQRLLAGNLLSVDKANGENNTQLPLQFDRE